MKGPKKLTKFVLLTWGWSARTIRTNPFPDVQKLMGIIGHNLCWENRRNSSFGPKNVSKLQD